MAKTIGSFDLASLKYLRDDVTQYFWFEPDSSSAWGSGAHVTLYPESQFTDSTSPNYMKGQNIIMNTDGFSIRNGALPMMVLDNDSLDFNAVDTTLGTYTTMATFGLTGATIGKISGAHSVIDADGQRFYASNGTTQLANIGYASGAAQSGTAIAPYYDFGSRKSNTIKGNYSVAEGNNVTASGYVSHAEGDGTTASESCSHAEGSDATASGYASHAEGWNTNASKSAAHAEGDGTNASGYYSHAEGLSTTASGNNSHAQNNGTIAGYVSQTAIGEYNKNASINAFEIGNGSSYVRSNAFAVDWYGAAHLANNLFTECNADGTGGYEFGRKTSSHIVVAGIHICWGLETITHTGSGYKEVQVTLPYTYTSAPRCFASYGNRLLSGAPRTAYATQGSLAGNKIYVGSYATADCSAYVNWMTIGA